MTEQGYNATSLDQVIAESSSSKGAFFHHFSSKADLALQLIERYVAADLANLDAGLDGHRRHRGPADTGRGVPAVLRGRRRRADVRAVRLPLRHGARRAGVHRKRRQRPGRQGRRCWRTRRRRSAAPGAAPPAVPTSTSTSMPSPTTSTPPSRAPSSCAARWRTPSAMRCPAPRVPPAGRGAAPPRLTPPTPGALVPQPDGLVAVKQSWVLAK